MSDETEAAVELAFGTLSTLVSLMWILSIGIDRQWEQICTILVCMPWPQ